MSNVYKENTVRRLEGVRVAIYRPNGRRYDVGRMAETVTWSGDEETSPRQVSVSLRNNIERKREVYYTFGDMVVILVRRFGKDIEIFRGMIYNVENDQTGNESFTAYDNLFYLVKSSNTVIYKNINATDIIRRELQACGLPIGNIAKINYKVKKKIFENVSREQIVKDVLALVESNTGKKYKLISEKGKVSLVERQSAARNTIYLPYLNSGSRSASIEDIATQVMITKNGIEDKKFKKLTKTDVKLAEKYGYIQHVIQAGEKDTEAQMRKRMDNYIKNKSRPEIQVSVSSIGDIKCYTGRKIEFYDQQALQKNDYYISSDTHTFSGGTHTMDLQLSTRLE